MVPYANSIKEKLTFILRATLQHSKNLAFFVAMYRSLMWLCKMVWGTTRPYHSFSMAGITGYVVFGENNPVNMQVSKGLMCFIMQVSKGLMCLILQTVILLSLWLCAAANVDMGEEGVGHVPHSNKQCFLACSIFSAGLACKESLLVVQYDVIQWFNHWCTMLCYQKAEQC